MTNLLIECLVDLMKTAGRIKEMNGNQKKIYVLDRLRFQMALDGPIEDLIIGVIDILIDVEKGKLVLNQKVKDSFFCCSGSRRK
jgi:hypothetical protein